MESRSITLLRQNAPPGSAGSFTPQGGEAVALPFGRPRGSNLTGDITCLLMLLVMGSLGKALILVGILLVVLGALFSLGAKIPWLEQLPGDIYIRNERFTFYFPLASCLILSLVISLVLYLFRR